MSMETAANPARKIPLSALVIAIVSLFVLVGGITYLNRPVPHPADTGGASAEAKAYLPNLQLSDVKMTASENFMKQQVVEVAGNIANHGTRKLALVEVYCLFYGLDGKEVYRERIALVRNLTAQETRAFRLPFDSLPDGWNQAMPRLAIAKITFAG
jgi:hypothetical protein